jgi:MFS family permease
MRARTVLSLGSGAGALAPLAQGDFRLLWLSTTGWNTARWMEMVAVGWLVFELTHSPLLVALAGLCRSLAVPLLGLASGVIADRVDRLRLMRLMQCGNVVVGAALAASILTGRVAVWQLLAGALFFGLSWAVDWPSRRAFTADLVPREQVLPAIVLDSFSMYGSKVLGPILAGWLIDRAGIGATYAVIAAGFACGVVPLLFIRPRARPRSTGQASALATLVEGLRYVARVPSIRGVLLITVVMNCMAFPFMGLLPVIAADTLRVGPSELGLLAAADGIGAVIALPLAVQLRREKWQGWAFIAGSLLICVSLAAFAGSSWYALSLALLVAGGFGHTGFGTMQSTIILTGSAEAMRGRAMGALTLAIGASPLGSAEMGLLAQQWGAPFAVGLNAAAGALLVGLVALLTPSLFREARTGERCASAAAVPAEQASESAPVR